jgi:hypothetical protein
MPRIVSLRPAVGIADDNNSRNLYRSRTRLIQDQPVASAVPVVVAAATMIALGLLAAYFSARRAASIDPRLE